jgi:hypothetical protein
MHDTELYLGFWEYGIDRIWKAFKPIYTGDKNIFYTSILQFSYYVQPKFGAFVFG